MRMVFALLVLISVSACSGYKYQPYSITATGGIPQNGSPEFNKGWQDGCDSGMAAFGNLTYKMLYTFKKDYALSENAEYTAAWNAAYTTCRWYTSTWLTPIGEEPSGFPGSVF